MAVFAIIAAGDMSRIFSNCYDAVMAGATRANDLSVVYRIGGYPHIRVVAVFANISRLNVRKVFASGFNTVVTTGAIAGDTDMIEVCR